VIAVKVAFIEVFPAIVVGTDVFVVVFPGAGLKLAHGVAHLDGLMDELLGYLWWFVIS
jgi:hypothetical protein